MGFMHLEIGSEFFQTEYKSGEKILFLSGRTALDFILRDIIKEREIESALLPSFCCHTMIEPFLKNKIPVRFYNVYFAQGRLRADIPEARKQEIFFKIRYFGYSQLEGLNDEAVRDNWECVIEDCTHYWLSDDLDIDMEYDDYRFTSYRKWTGLLGIAMAEKKNGRFAVRQEYRINTEYEAFRWNAREKKRDYIAGKTSDKTGYLKNYTLAEEILEKDYQDYGPTPDTVHALMNLDIGYIRQKRKENADYLMNRLRDLEGIHLMFPVRQKGNTPLCVPILVHPDVRDRLKRYLILKEIYCPVHWPLTKIHAGISDREGIIYAQELSLICDQRYDLDAMEKEAYEIHNFFMETHYDKSLHFE